MDELTALIKTGLQASGLWEEYQKITSRDYLEPEEEILPGEKVIGVMDETSKKLYTLMKQYDAVIQNIELDKQDPEAQRIVINFLLLSKMFSFYFVHRFGQPERMVLPRKGFRVIGLPIKLIPLPSIKTMIASGPRTPLLNWN